MAQDLKANIWKYLRLERVTSKEDRIISGLWNGSIKVWDIETGECLKKLGGEHVKGITSVAITKLVKYSVGHMIP